MKSNITVIMTRAKGRPWNISISVMSFRILLILFTLFFMIGSASLFFNFKMIPNYLNSQGNDTYSKEQQEVINTLSDEVQSLRKMMEELIRKEEEIRQDLGRPKYRKLSLRRLIRSKERQFARQYPDHKDAQSLGLYELSSQMSFLKNHVVMMEKKMRRHVSVFDQYVDWFHETPSIWPVYGYIRSGYGWRTHPLKRSRQFHKGIDIPAWIGAPVQATADGYVEFSGWGGGYGWMVVLSHKFGIKTFYAHLSEVEVRQGVRVNKGQIIGKIGTSGLSTGPHVHYEIRHRRQALEPTQFLNLDLFTAVSKLW
ncbi:MAG: M23 family metallopeptidase [Candidatus Margulisiibacteriota bacterium]